MMELVLAGMCGAGITALPFMIWVSKLQSEVRFAQMQAATMFKAYAENSREKIDVTC